MKRTMKILAPVFAAMLISMSGCKEVAIVPPDSPVTNDFNVPAYVATGPTVRLTLSDERKVVYFGQPFVVKVSLYSVTRSNTASLWAALCDIALPRGLQIVSIVNNTALFKTSDSSQTLPLIYVEPPSNIIGSYGLVYTNGSTPNVDDNGVLFNLVCVASSGGIAPNSSVTLDSTNVKATLYTVNKNTKVSPSNQGQLLPFVFVPLQVTVSDEFGNL